MTAAHPDKAFGWIVAVDIVVMGRCGRAAVGGDAVTRAVIALPRHQGVVRRRGHGQWRSRERAHLAILVHASQLAASGSAEVGRDGATVSEIRAGWVAQQPARLRRSNPAHSYQLSALSSQLSARILASDVHVCRRHNAFYLSMGTRRTCRQLPNRHPDADGVICPTWPLQQVLAMLQSKRQVSRMI